MAFFGVGFPGPKDFGICVGYALVPAVMLVLVLYIVDLFRSR